MFQHFFRFVGPSIHLTGAKHREFEGMIHNHIRNHNPSKNSQQTIQQPIQQSIQQPIQQPYVKRTSHVYPGQEWPDEHGRIQLGLCHATAGS